MIGFHAIIYGEHGTWIEVSKLRKELTTDVELFGQGNGVIQMKPRKIKDNIYWMGSLDWGRRFFDSLIRLPDGTSCNAYLIQGSEMTALVDSVDPPSVVAGPGFVQTRVTYTRYFGGL
jgi:hypothetical protein